MLNEQEFITTIKEFDNIEKIIADYHWCNLIDESNGEEQLSLYDEIESILYVVRDFIRSQKV